MTGVIAEILKGSWPLLGFALILFAMSLVVFGLLPGVVTRLFARLYPKSDPRRNEMIAELYAVPRVEQPWWVMQQVERSIAEGIPARFHRRAAKTSPSAPLQDAQAALRPSHEMLDIAGTIARYLEADHWTIELFALDDATWSLKVRYAYNDYAPFSVDGYLFAWLAEQGLSMRWDGIGYDRDSVVQITRA